MTRFVAVVVALVILSATIVAAEKVTSKVGDTKATVKVAEVSQSSTSWQKVLEIPTPSANEEIVQMNLDKTGRAIVFTTKEITPTLQSGKFLMSRDRAYLFPLQGKNVGKLVPLVDEQLMHINNNVKARLALFAPKGGIITLGFQNSFWKEDGQFLRRTDHGSSPNPISRLLTAQEGDRFVWWGGQTAAIWSSTGQVGTVHIKPFMERASISANGQHLLTVGDHYAQRWKTGGSEISTRRHEKMWRLSLPSVSTDAALSYDGSCAAVAYLDGVVDAISPEKGQESKTSGLVWRVPLAPEGIAVKARSVTFEPNLGSNRLLITCDWQGLSTSETRILLLDATIAHGEPVLVGSQTGVIGASFLDPLTAVSFGQTGISTWDFATLSEEKLDEGAFTKVEVAKDCKAFAAIKDDGKALVLYKKLQSPIKTTAVN